MQLLTRHRDTTSFVVCAVNEHKGHVATPYAFVQLCNTWDFCYRQQQSLLHSSLNLNDHLCVLVHRPLEFTCHLYEKNTQDRDRIDCHWVTWITGKLYAVTVWPKSVAHINESYLICDSPFFCLEHPVSTLDCSAVVEDIWGTGSFIVCWRPSSGIWIDERRRVSFA